MNVIFLDVDGVLNSHGLGDDNARPLLEKECFIRLSKLCKEASASIVLHSGWRFWFDENMRPKTLEAQRLADLLNEHGMGLYDKTPDFSIEEIKKMRKFSMVKAQEILTWLKMNTDVKNYVILQDLDLNNDEVRVHQVKTDGMKGISDADAQQAILIMQNESEHMV